MGVLLENDDSKNKKGLRFLPMVLHYLKFSSDIGKLTADLGEREKEVDFHSQFFVSFKPFLLPCLAYPAAVSCKALTFGKHE